MTNLSELSREPNRCPSAHDELPLRRPTPLEVVWRLDDPPPIPGACAGAPGMPWKPGSRGGGPQKLAAGLAWNIPSKILCSFPTRPPGYCQNQNVTKPVTARVQNAKALGLKMAARSSEVGCDTPQKWQRMASDDTVAEQFLQVRFDLRMTRREETQQETP
jgi:hypothetical protein